MKKNCLQTLCVSLLMFFTICVAACRDDSPDGPDVPQSPDVPQEILPVPGLSFTSITLPQEGDVFACTIHGLTEGNWSAECQQPWCSVSVNGNILKINVLPNEESGKRSATVSILHSDKRELGSIAVTQSYIAENEKLENSVSSKQTFYPMFTATWCPFSPDMDRTLVEIQKRWDYPILPMRIHVKNSELYNPLSVELSELYNNSTTPTGYFENFFEVNNMADGNVSVDYFWNLILSKTALGSGYTGLCSSIGCKAAMSDWIIDAEVSIKPVESGRYRLLAFILEDNIIRPQMSKNDGEIPNYCHDGVLVGALTSMKGQELELTSSKKIISMTGSVPSTVNLSELRLLVVLERNVAYLNYSDECWYVDNCLSVSLGKTFGNGMIENIYIGEEIEN